LIVSTDFLKQVKDIWRPEWIETPEYQRIARWCLAHFEEYHCAPDRDIEQIYLSAIREEGIPKAEAELIEGALSAVSGDYGRGDQFNSAYLFDQTIEFFKKRALEEHSERVGALAERGQYDEAEESIKDYRPVAGGTDDDLLALITPRQHLWVWEYRVPLGKVTLFAGDSDLGKSTVLTDIGARTSSGTDWPDGTRARQGAVLIASAEDDFADTVIPRLMAAGADLNFCYRIGRDAANITELVRDIEKKILALQGKKQRVRVVLIDPLSAYLGKVDQHNEGAVRVGLRPLGEAAMWHRFAVVTLHHTRKAGSGGSAKDQVAGSKAFTSACRSGFLITRDKDDESKRLMIFLKGNLVPDNKKTGLAYRLVGQDVPIHTSPRGAVTTTNVSRVAWLSVHCSMWMKLLPFVRKFMPSES
jgi:hypothetical protein